MFSSNTSQVSDEKLYVEDVMSVFLYTGNGSTQTITTGIDLSSKGGMIWQKPRTTDSTVMDHKVFDTARGQNNVIYPNLTSDQNNGRPLSWTSSGFTLDAGSQFYGLNQSGVNYVSWTFRKAPKFFDVVTYTGNGVSGRQIAHSLGVAPGTIMVKRTDNTGGWRVYHRSQPNGYGDISSTDAFYTASAERVFGNGSTVVAPSSTEFTIGDVFSVNGSGATYVAYLFAHDTTSDGIIQCGSFTTDGSGNATVNLGWEPQWLLTKPTSTTGNWVISDTMRGYSQTATQWLYPNTSGAEVGAGPIGGVNATGFKFDGIYAGGTTVAYIAIRRGPMRTPTSGTSVFSPVIYSGDNNPNRVVSHSITPDAAIQSDRGYGFANVFPSRLIGINTPYINYADPEGQQRFRGWAVQNGILVGEYGEWNYNPGTPLSYVQLAFKRAPGFFDVVCYTGTGVANRQVTHNLGVVPELIMIKCRSASTNWEVLASSIPRRLNFNTTSAGSTPPPAIVFGDDTNYVSPTSSYFVIGTNGTVNSSANTYIAYLFSSCPGVSKVGSYTGNGSSQTIDCGFAAGARFFLVKRTDSTGDWWVYDSARGITAPADPALKLNVDVEVTSADAVDPTSSGIIVNQESSCNINVSSATYIYLAVA